MPSIDAAAYASDVSLFQDAPPGRLELAHRVPVGHHYRTTCDRCPWASVWMSGAVVAVEALRAHAYDEHDGPAATLDRRAE